MLKILTEILIPFIAVAISIAVILFVDGVVYTIKSLKAERSEL